MNKIISALAILIASSFANAHNYEVTIENITEGQGFSPPIIAIHKRRYDFLKNGTAASAGVMLLAEDGNPLIWNRELKREQLVVNSTTGQGLTNPGTSRIFTVTAPNGNPNLRISVALMLVTTNDGLTVVESKRLPKNVGDRVEYLGKEYDSGTEFNSELGSTIPLPANNFHVRDFEKAEGFIHRHKGIQGNGDYSPADYGFQNGASKVTIERVK